MRIVFMTAKLMQSTALNLLSAYLSKNVPSQRFMWRDDLHDVQAGGLPYTLVELRGFGMCPALLEERDSLPDNPIGGNPAIGSPSLLSELKCRAIVVVVGKLVGPPRPPYRQRVSASVYSLISARASLGVNHKR